MKVLIVDDNALNRKLLNAVLDAGGHQVVEAADGHQALAVLRREQVDAMISDIVMPGMDGFSLCSEVRRTEQLHDLPIIIFSATLLSDSDHQLARRVGADRFIGKPAGADVILRALTEVEGARHPRPPVQGPDWDLKVLKEYSEGLVRKLEERNEALEAAQRDLAAANAELRASEERYRTLFDRNPLPAWVFDPETLAILAVNEAAVEHYGYSREEFLAMTLRGVRPPEDVPKLLAVDRSARDRREASRWRHRKKDGTLIDVDVYTHEVVLDGRTRRLAVLRDVTDQKRLEEQFRHAQKMEAVGRLAAGIAHDFNNLLTVILGFSDLLAKRAGEGGAPQDRGEIAEIRKAGERAAALTRQLLAFSRMQVMTPEILDLNATVVDLEKMLRRVLGEDLELSTVLDPKLGRIKADPGQIGQVIMNLAINARDAMPDGGRLTIETRNVDLDEEYAREHAVVQPGSYVMLAVSDTGIGMDAYTQSRIFEPFFTTKEQGKGTGLGLSTLYGIVKQSGGYIWVYSELGHGTTFKIYLPRVEAPLAPSKRSSQAIPLDVLAGHETVLLAEDDDAVRLLARLALEKHGYSVLAAASGAEALEIERGYAKPIHVLLTDMLMPGMNGTELAARLAVRRPEIKVLVMSGYSESALTGHAEPAANFALLEKPFTADSLARKLRQLLSA